MSAFVATVGRFNGNLNQIAGHPKAIVRNSQRSRASVEVGNGAIAPKIAIQRAKASSPVRVEVGNGAIAPKIAIQRAKSSWQL